MDKEQVLVVAKLLVAIAWVDEEVHSKEKELIGLLLDSRNDVNEDDLLRIQLYYEFPLIGSEIQFLLKRFKEVFNKEEDVNDALYWINRLILSDGKIQEVETSMYEKLHSVIVGEKEGSVVGGFSKGVTRSPFAMQVKLGRERHYDDYMYNPVYFRFSQKIQRNGALLEDELLMRKVCLAITLCVQVVDVKVDGFKAGLLDLFKSWQPIHLNRLDTIIDEALCLEKSIYNQNRICVRFVGRTDSAERKTFFEKLIRIQLNNNELSRKQEAVSLQVASKLDISPEFSKSVLKLI